MAIIAQRAPADKPGPDIITFLKLPTSLLEIGRQEINENGQDVIILTMEMLNSDYIQPGHIAKIVYGPATFYGMVMSYDVSVTVAKKALSTVTTIEVEVPLA